MKNFLKRTVLPVFLAGCTLTGFAQAGTSWQQEPYRPQIHFTPMKHWMNDPNGMVYLNGVYHLFYQHYPGGTTWGPMHWGHATSTDLVHWKEQSVKLYPDSLGYIFSGSAVYDKENTSGLGVNNKGPLVAVFTHHLDPEKTGGKDFQYQSLAYSNDEGKTWTKYSGNPVLRKPAGTDFRDPKVFWHEGQKKWIMTLAVKDRIEFYSAPDLKTWKYESEFGADLGAHGGVWECPDLFQLEYNGKKQWVLIVNINPGAPNGGSGTQYFLGDFVGTTFRPSHTDTRWMDYGPDNYAGVTWSNTGDRKVLIGWMSNWNYANVVPTKNWRSATTIVRELSLKEAGGKLYLASTPVAELSGIQEKCHTLNKQELAGSVDLSGRLGEAGKPFRLDLEMKTLTTFRFILSNKKGEELIVGYEAGDQEYYIDRSRAGVTSFHESFAGRHSAPRFSVSRSGKVTLLVDNSSVELFADTGLSVMTGLYFSSDPFTSLRLETATTGTSKKVTISRLKSIHTD